MKSKDELQQKRAEIDAIRRVGHEAGLGEFTRGQLAGAQQALWWTLGLGLEPVRAILSDEEVAALKALCEAGE